MFDTIGREAGCRRLAAAFYEKVATDTDLKPLFPGKTLRCAAEEFAAFLIQFFDGSPDDTQYRWWLSLRESHARFRISERQRIAWLTHMAATVEQSVSDPLRAQSLRDFFGQASLYITGQAASPPLDSELARLWERQLALERWTATLREGNDSEVIAGAPAFASRPSVYPGVLARMMDASRPPLIDFVVGSLAADPNRARNSFNGRPLLHHAAGSACLPVVKTILATGFDPNSLDRGGHSALFRAAGAPDTEAAGLVVRELVRSGATLDLDEGVNRATPLHEAVRHGNLTAVKTLLDLGASTQARDKRGQTPLDRARQSRKPQALKQKLLEALS